MKKCEEKISNYLEDFKTACFKNRILAVGGAPDS